MPDNFNEHSLDSIVSTLKANQESFKKQLEDQTSTLKQQMMDHNTALIFKLDVADRRFMQHEKVDEDRHKSNFESIKDILTDVKSLEKFKWKLTGIIIGFTFIVETIKLFVESSHKP